MSDYGRDKICVEFNGEAQQNVLAEICEMCSLIKYQLYKQDAINYEQIGEKLVCIVDRFQITPQHWSEMYDVLHRSGWNK